MSTLSASTRDARSPTRRNILLASTATVAAIAASPISAMSAAAALNDVDHQAIDLWERRGRLMAEWAEVSALDKAARDQLPWWMKPGPRHLYADGSFGEECSGWPAIPDAKPPSAGRIDIRPDENELWGLYQVNRDLDLETARTNYDEARADLRARIEARDREYDRLGLMEADKRRQRVLTAIYEIDQDIGDLDCEQSFYAAAAKTLLMLREMVIPDGDWSDADFDPGIGMFLVMLRLLRPSVAGEIAEDVDRVLAAADTLVDGAILAAIDPSYT